MITQEIVVVGASAGGVEALIQLVSQLPPEFAGTLFVVLHLSGNAVSALPQILTRHGRLPALHPTDDVPIRPGRIYVAPPDRHLILLDDHVVLSHGPRENGHRPAIDPLFRSAARVYGERVVGVVLSGTQEDGTAGLQAIKMLGGIAIVQDPAGALYGGMPRSALENVAIDYVLPVAEIGALLARLASASAASCDPPLPAPDMEKEVAMANVADGFIPETEHPGTPSTYGCPDCGGTLWEIREGNLVRFRCRVGHSWSDEGLLARQNDALEEALWSAVRALEESASLARRMAGRARDRGHELVAQRFEEQTDDAMMQSARRRDVLARGSLANGSHRTEPQNTDA